MLMIALQHIRNMELARVAAHQDAFKTEAMAQKLVNLLLDWVVFYYYDTWTHDLLIFFCNTIKA